MRPIHFIELLLLSAIWGGSFMFMRISAPEFGTLALATFRMSIAGITLLPIFLFYWQRRLALPYSSNSSVSNKQVTKHIWFVALFNSVLPMFLFAYAAANLDAGFASILNATTPLWGALIGALMYANKLSKIGVTGLLVGFIGVIILSFDKVSGNIDQGFLSVIAIVTATALYGFSANYSKKYLAGVKPLFIAAASLFWGAIMMLPILIYSLPDLSAITTQAWVSLLALGMLSTGLAYILYYRIIAHSGPTKAMMVTYLIPVFGVLFGYLFLSEQLTINIFYGGALILFGVAITTGVFFKRK